MAGIKRRTDPKLAAAIEEFAAAADAPQPKEPSRPAVTVDRPAIEAERPSQRRGAARRPATVGYEDLAEKYSYLGNVGLDDLPATFLLKHDGVKEDAMLIALLADAEDRSKNYIVQRALLDGLRLWAERLRQDG